MQLRILLDECVHRRIQADLKTYYDEVRRVQELNLQGVKEGAILHLVKNDFDVFITTERKEDTLKHDLGDSRQYGMGIIVIDPRDAATHEKLHPTIENIRPLYGAVFEEIEGIQKGEMVRIQTARKVHTMKLKEQKKEARDKKTEIDETHEEPKRRHISRTEEEEMVWRRGLSPSERADLDAAEADARRELTSAEFYVQKQQEKHYIYEYRHRR